MDYKELIVKVIEQGSYELADMEQRITRLWLEGKITESDRDELMPMAAQYANERYQIDVLAKIANLEQRVYNLEWPTDQYVIWQAGYQTKQGETVRYDVTGDGEYDLCRYDGGRSYTALSIGKIEGWHLTDREGNATHTITRDSDGGYVLTPIEPAEEVATEPAAESETTEGE